MNEMLQSKNRVSEWIYAAHKRLSSDLGTHRLKVRGWRKIFHANGNQKKSREAILVCDKIDFKIKKIQQSKIYGTQQKQF